VAVRHAGSMLPLLAVTGRHIDQDRVSAYRADALIVPRAYVDAVRRAGGEAGVLLPRPVTAEDAPSILTRFDGLLLTGGGDINPARYGQTPHPSVYGVDDERDAFELALARAAVEAEMPVFGICRGMQILNVALGGSLEQHILDRGTLLPHGDPTKGAVLHAVALDASSRLAAAVGTVRTMCSSHHHQAVDRLGDGLTVVGRSDDGLPEALELEGPAWVVGVQWHPEDTAAVNPEQQRLFDTLVTEAAGARRT
jgi:putative glutamine amidotransferase